MIYMNQTNSNPSFNY